MCKAQEKQGTRVVKRYIGKLLFVIRYIVEVGGGKEKVGEVRRK